jgi:hypothetical protein
LRVSCWSSFPLILRRCIPFLGCVSFPTIIIMHWCRSALISSDSARREGRILRDGESCGFSELTTWKTGTHFNWGSNQGRGLMWKQVKRNALRLPNRWALLLKNQIEL